MPNVIADISMSLDGFVTGDGADEQHGLGGGTPLFKPGTRQMYRQRDARPSRNAVHLTYERV